MKAMGYITATQNIVETNDRIMTFKEHTIEAASNITIIIKDTAVSFTSDIEPWGADNLGTDDLEPIFPPTIIECGKAPFNLVGPDLKGYTTFSYNNRYSTGATNGAYQSAATIYIDEKPYYKFEVAREDAYNAEIAEAGHTPLQNWTSMQGTAANHGDHRHPHQAEVYQGVIAPPTA